MCAITFEIIFTPHDPQSPTQKKKKSKKEELQIRSILDNLRVSIWLQND